MTHSNHCCRIDPPFWLAIWWQEIAQALLCASWPERFHMLQHKWFCPEHHGGFSQLHAHFTIVAPCIFSFQALPCQTPESTATIRIKIPAPDKQSRVADVHLCERFMLMTSHFLLAPNLFWTVSWRHPLPIHPPCWLVRMEVSLSLFPSISTKFLVTK